MSKKSQLSSCFLRSIFIQMLVFTFPDTAKNENFHFFASCPKNDMQSTLKKQIQYFKWNRSPGSNWARVRRTTQDRNNTRVHVRSRLSHQIFWDQDSDTDSPWRTRTWTWTNLKFHVSAKLCSVAVPINVPLDVNY